ncbi:MAG: hypothetical protein FJW30_07070 [Acidobacteria bacterium]|nr:hypothetical protein [Acidobacteriota bacterium]
MRAIVSSVLFAAALAAQPGIDLDAENRELIRRLTDWAGLTRYGSENTELPPAKNRAVLLGDDAFDVWGGGAAPYVNRGIAKQTTGQMLVRFRQDVIALKPAVVVIQGGSNDIAGFAGPATLGTLSENIETMADLARFHNIKVVLASVLPVCDCAGRELSQVRTPGRLMGINEWLEEYAKQRGLIYVNLYTPLAQGRAFRKELTADGLVPNAAGYALVKPLLDKAIAEALASR